MRPAREGREPIYKLSTLTSITKRVVHNDARIARGGRDGGEIRARRDGVREECDGDIHSLTRCPLLSFPSRHVITQLSIPGFDLETGTVRTDEGAEDLS
jgi:hypothetical protein